MDKWTDDPFEHTMYRNIVGKIIFITVKIFPEVVANAARELARHFSNLGPKYWEELGRYVGYFKGSKLEIQTNCKPKELRALSYVDSNYATQTKKTGEVLVEGYTQLEEQ
jgi:hypothetical protein